MNLRTFPLFLAIVLLCIGHQSRAAECVVGTPLQHSFASGASWEMCVLLDDRHGLEFRDVAYRAPNDSLRLVLRSIHMAESLMHYHEDTESDALIGTLGLGGSALAEQTAQNCSGEPIDLNNAGVAHVCSEVETAGLLVKYGVRPAIHADKWTLSVSSTVRTFNLSTQLSFYEDGKITPGNELSGRILRFTDNQNFGNRIDNSGRYAARATLLYTWRMDFALNTEELNDIVEEHSHAIISAQVARRPLKVTRIDTEVFRNVDRENFRGWRIRDEDGSGYYLDPQNSGYNYTSRTHNWAQYDFAVSARNNCEQYALNNVGEDSATCGNSLDDYINGESLLSASPIVWFSLTRIFNPSMEDVPAIASIPAQFELIPFDWTNASPFELPQ